MAEKQKILIVDDDASISELISLYLEKEMFDTRCAADGEEALQLFPEYQPNLVILDLMLPGIDGYEVCRRLRASSQVPVIMLSARGEEYDKLYGFELGIEDYVVKPFSLKELMARVKVVIRRHQASAPKLKSKDVLEFGGLTINIPGRKVSIDGERITMTPKEYDLLFFLASHEDIVFSRDELLEKIWGFDFYGDGRTVDSHIKMLRHSLGKYRHFIVTHRGVGYKFEAE